MLVLRLRPNETVTIGSGTMKVVAVEGTRRCPVFKLGFDFPDDVSIQRDHARHKLPIVTQQKTR